MIQASESAKSLEWDNFMASLQGPEPVTMSVEEFRAYVAAEDEEYRRKHVQAAKSAGIYLLAVAAAVVVGWLVMRQW